MTELDNRFDLLTQGSRDLLPHQQALETTIAWSYDLLQPEAQAVFRRLSVFAGGFTRDAATAVVPAAGPAGRYLTGTILDLVGDSLLRSVADTAPARYVALESLRAFGRERLAEAGELEPTSQAHAEFFLGLAREAAPQLNGPEQAVWMDRLEVDLDNLRAGLDWATAAGKGETAIGMVETLWRFWNARGLLSEGRRRVEETIRRFDTDTEKGSARLPLAAGMLARSQGDYPAAETWFDEALRRARSHDDPGAAAAALNNLGNVALSRGDHRRAAGLFEESLAASRALNDPRRQAAALSNLGAVAHYLGELDRAEASYVEALSIWKREGDRRPAALLLGNLAMLLAPQPERRDQTRAFAEECLSESKALGYPAGVAAALTALGLIAEGDGDLERAAHYHEESASVCRESENRSGLARALGNQSVIVAELGDVDRAVTLVNESLRLFVELGDDEGTAATMEMQAVVARFAGELRLAARLHGAAAVRWNTLAMPMPLAFARRHDTSVAALRGELSEVGFEAEWDAGSKLTTDDAIREMDRLLSVAGPRRGAAKELRSMDMEADVSQ